MRIVLCESTHASQSADFARLLPAIDRSKFAQSHRQISIRMRFAGIDADVMWAVHRLEQIALDFALFHAVCKFATSATLFRKFAHLVLINNRWVLTLAIKRKVAACFIQLEFPDMWREDLLISLHAQCLTYECLKFLPDCGAARSPQHQSLSNHFIDVKKSKLLSKHSMIALFCLFELFEMCFEFWFRRKGCPIDASQSIKCLIAFPIA